MPQTERSAQAVSLEPLRLFPTGESLANHGACEKFGETPDGAQAPPVRPPALSSGGARVGDGLPVTARGESASAVGIRKAGRWPVPSRSKPQGEDSRWLPCAALPLGESLPGSLGHKLKCDGWRVACLFASAKRLASSFNSDHSLGGGLHSFFLLGQLYTFPRTPTCQKGYY
jgi:hypothetical protein